MICLLIYFYTLLEVIGDLSRSALIQTMVRGMEGMEAWESVTSFCEAVLLANEEVERERKIVQFPPCSSRRRPEDTPWASRITRPAIVGAGLRTASSSSPSNEDQARFSRPWQSLNSSFHSTQSGRGYFVIFPSTKQKNKLRS